MAGTESNSDGYFHKKDFRTVCKYGSQCYQKNEDHHEKYKHPQPALQDTANAAKTITKTTEGTSNTTKGTFHTTKGTFHTTKLKLPPAKKQKLLPSFKFKPLDFTFKKKQKTTAEADKPAVVLKEMKRAELVTAEKPTSSRFLSLGDDMKPDKRTTIPQKTQDRVAEADKPAVAFKEMERLELVTADKPTSSRSLSLGDDMKLYKRTTLPQTIQDRVADTSSTQLIKNLGKIIDEEDLPPSPEDPKESIKQKFLVEMPEDFYSFWLFCTSLNSDNPDEALKVAGLYLVGPFDILSGKLKNCRYRKPSLYLRHWRYYYDPPEFQTVVRGDDSKLFHMGYFRDDPDCAPCFVAGNSAGTDCTIAPLAENLFGAVHWFLEAAKHTCNPFKQTRLSQLHSSLQRWAKAHDFPLDRTTPATKARTKAVVARTFHTAGIVVPYNKKTELGYRPPIETEANLRKMMTRVLDAKDDDFLQRTFMGKLIPVITAANIANDECDFGASLELGLNLFSFGGEVFHKASLGLLSTAYMLLNRRPFSTILQAHLQDRRKGGSLSIIDM